MKTEHSSRVKMPTLSILVCWALLFSPGLTGTLTAQTVSNKCNPPGSFSCLVEKVSPSVVNISSVKITENPNADNMPFRHQFGEDDPFQEFFERFFGDRMPKEFRESSLGSGFVIDTNGYILTNNHVVENPEKIRVSLNNNEYEAKLIGRDPKTDLALIKIDTDEQLTPLPLGDSEKLKVGDWVVAIGSPYGLGNTVTAGIVSGKFRHLGLGAYDDFIQTDASINPGNSGGPLLNVKGEVVGINTAIFSRGRGNIGIGFAIPINMAKVLLPQLREGKVVRGWLGVVIQAITPELKQKLGLTSEQGALVSDVTKDSPADKAGLKRGDVIISFDGKEIKVMNDLPYLVATTPVGKKVPIEVVRNGEKIKLEAVITEARPESAAPTTEGKEEKTGSRLGLKLQENSPDFASQYNLSESRGLVVVGVVPYSPAYMAGFRIGDIILELDRQPVGKLDEFLKKVNEYQKGETLLFLIQRKSSTLYLTLKVPE